MSIDSNEVPRQLPDNPNLRHLKNQARDLLKAGEAKSLTDAQFKIARLYGFPSWPKLKAHLDALKKTGRLKHEIDIVGVDLVNKDERTREERFSKIRMYELLKQDAGLKLEALRKAHGAPLTQEQEAKLKEELSRSAQEIEEELRRPRNKVMTTSEPRAQELAKDELAKLAQIPMRQAIQIATAHQPGTVVECHLGGGREEGREYVFYEVWVLSAKSAENTVTRFMINAIDGRIMGQWDEAGKKWLFNQ